MSVLAAAAMGMALQGCNPCAGIITGCTESPRVSIDGQIVNHPEGTPAEGVVVSLALAAGSPPVASAETDALGFYHMETAVSETGTFDTEITIDPPGFRSYRVRRPVTAATLRGGGAVLETMVSRPYFNAIAPVVPRCDDSKPIALQRFALRFPDGRVNPIAGGATGGTTDSTGTIVFLAPAFVTDTFTPLVADLLLPDLPGRLAGAVRVGQDYIFRSPLKLATVRVARDSSYVGCVIDQATNRPAAGIPVEFTRTGGAATQVATYAATTDATGAFVLPLVPLEPGPVVGTLTLRPPTPAAPRVFAGAVIGSSIEPADTLKVFPVDLTGRGPARPAGGAPLP